MFGAYTTARAMAISRLVIRFFWSSLSSVFVTYVYLWVYIITLYLIGVMWKRLFIIPSIIAHIVHKWNFRKLLEEKNKRNSDSFYFRIYILVLGVYAGIRLVFGILLKFRACHALSEMSDQSFFQFFKWIYQVFIVLRDYIVHGLLMPWWYTSLNFFIKFFFSVFYRSVILWAVDFMKGPATI